MPHTTPAALARELGCNERYLRALARRLGACRQIGKTMVLLPEDVERIRLELEPHKLIAERALERIAELEEAEANRLPKGADIDRVGLVYFVACKDRVKIGFTTNVARRMVTLVTFCPYPVEVLATMTGTPCTEHTIHQRFSEFRAQGEWFVLTPEIRAFIKEFADAAH